MDVEALTRRVARALPNPVYWPLLIAAALSMALVFLARLQSVLQAHGRYPTSGVEGAGAFGVYQVCAGAPLYHDFTQSPNGYIFNFIFYEFYGTVAGLFGDCATATPLAGRLLTVAFVVALGAAIFLARNARLSALEAAAIAAAVISPYVGWWVFALRPDVAATTFFACGVIATLRYLRRPALPALVAAVLCLICAWGFKQPYGFAAPVMLWFIARTNFRHALIFAILLLAGLCLPFFVYGIRPYFFHTIYSESRMPLYVDIAAGNIVSFVVKSAAVLLLTGITLTALRNARREPERDFLVAMLAVSFGVMAILAAKAGASDNYFFPPFVTALLLIVRLAPDCDPALRRVGFAAYAVLSILLSLAVLTGHRGVIALPAEVARQMNEEAATINRMPGPKLVWHDTMAMPWFTGDVALRIANIGASSSFEGSFNPATLVAARHYATIAIPPEVTPRFDLSGYALSKTFSDLLVYSRRQADGR